MYLNSDYGNYLNEQWEDGIPASSVRTREFDPASTHDYKNQVIQQYDEGPYLQYLLNEKLRILYKNPHRYHQSRLSIWDEQFYAQYLSNFVGYSGNLFDMCMSMPCDLVICQKQPNGEYELDFVHLVFPNGWSADDAIGRDFDYFHKPVERSNGTRVIPANGKFVEHLATSGKVYERVGAYSIHTESRLDKHPADTYIDNFTDPHSMYVRFERQVIVSVPQKNAFLFFIHTNQVDFRSEPELIGNAIENASHDAHSSWWRIEDYGPMMLNYLKDYRK